MDKNQQKKTEKILIADDEPSMRNVIMRLLSIRHSLKSKGTACGSDRHDASRSERGVLKSTLQMEEIYGILFRSKP